MYYIFYSTASREIHRRIVIKSEQVVDKKNTTLVSQRSKV